MLSLDEPLARPEGALHGLPTRGEPGSDEMLRETEENFEAHDPDVSVRIGCEMKVYRGCLAPRE
jgi:hypothetical protein